MPKKLEITFDMAKNIANEGYINPKKTIEEIKGNKYNIWNCGFIKFKRDFSF